MGFLLKKFQNNCYNELLRSWNWKFSQIPIPISVTQPCLSETWCWSKPTLIDWVIFLYSRPHSSWNSWCLWLYNMAKLCDVLLCARLLHILLLCWQTGSFVPGGHKEKCTHTYCGAGCVTAWHVMVIVSSVEVCDSKYGRLGGNVSAWQIGKGWFTPAPPRVKNVSRRPSALAFVTYVYWPGKAHLSDVHFRSGSDTKPSVLPT